jgi:ferredoxin
LTNNGFVNLEYEIWSLELSKMNETELKFEPENRVGVVAVGTYLLAAAKRLGVKLECECSQGNYDACACLIKRGGELLSPTTKFESEHLSELRRKNGERLACQSKIEKHGEITVMPTAAKKEEPTPTLFEQFKKEFASLTLQEKISQILELESLTLSDSFSAVLNLPYTIGEKIRDMMAEVGMKMEEEQKKAKTPGEHQTEPKAEEKPAAKTATEKKPAAKKPASAKKPAAKKPAATAKPKTDEAPK